MHRMDPRITFTLVRPPVVNIHMPVVQLTGATAVHGVPIRLIPNLNVTTMMPFVSPMVIDQRVSVAAPPNYDDIVFASRDVNEPVHPDTAHLSTITSSGDGPTTSPITPLASCSAQSSSCTPPHVGRVESECPLSPQFTLLDNSRSSSHGGDFVLAALCDQSSRGSLASPTGSSTGSFVRDHHGLTLSPQWDSVMPGASNFDAQKRRGNKLMHECAVCCKQFKRSYDLRVHARTHGQQPFQCAVCGRAFSQQANVRRHLKRHLVWPELQHTHPVSSQEHCLDVKFPCAYCNQACESHNALRKHLATTHLDRKVYACLVQSCRRSFNQAEVNEFLAHLQTHDGERVFECPQCKKTYRSLHAIGIHQHGHLLEPKEPVVPPKKRGAPYVCIKCTDEFMTYEGLMRHMAFDAHCYRCKVCPNRTFRSKRYYRRHVKLHMRAAALTAGMQQRFPCDKCSKVFRSALAWQMHASAHETLHPSPSYPCAICGRRFVRLFDCHRHQSSVHAQRKQFVCPEPGCKSQLSRKDLFRTHLLRHAKHKPHVCTICNKTFTRKDRLSDHLARHQNVYKFECVVCKRKFARKAYMDKHKCGRKPCPKRVKELHTSSTSVAGQAALGGCSQ